MPIRHSQTTSILAALLLLIGCGTQESDKRVVRIALRLEKQEAAVSRIAGRMEGIEHKLQRIRAWARKGGRTPAVEFKNTPQYKELAAALSGIQERLNLTEGSLAETREQIEQEWLRDPVRQFQAMADPQEFAGRLDALIQTFGPKIGDTARRQAFEADSQHLKDVNLNSPTDEEFLRWCISDYRRRLNTEQDERKRRFLEHVVGKLTSPPPADVDPGEFMAQVRLSANMLRLSKIVREHGVPGEALNDVGLFDVSERTSSVP